MRSFSEILLFPYRDYIRGQLHERLQGKTVLITGASYGIGECLALMLAETSAHLLLVARTAEKLEQVKTQIEQKGGKATVFVADLTDTISVDRLAAELLQLGSGIDIVVSNAGKSIRRPLMESLDRMHDINRTVGVNYLGPVQLLLPIIPTLINKQGQIINVSSASVLVAPAPYWAAYQASKSAFDQWLRSAALELEANGVAVTTLYLPLVKTRMIAPTKQYANIPAMRPRDVAAIICRKMCTRTRRWAPWWLVFAQVASVLFGGLWHSLNMRALRKKL